PDEARVLRVHAREHDDRLRAELRGDARVLRPRPHREVEQHDVHVGGGHRAAVAHGDVVAPDHVIAEHDVDAVGAQAVRELVAELALHRGERLAQEVAAVTEVEQAYAEGGGLQVRQRHGQTPRRYAIPGTRDGRTGMTGCGATLPQGAS